MRSTEGIFIPEVIACTEPQGYLNHSRLSCCLSHGSVACRPAPLPTVICTAAAKYGCSCCVIITVHLHAAHPQSSPEPCRCPCMWHTFIRLCARRTHQATPHTAWPQTRRRPMSTAQRSEPCPRRHWGLGISTSPPIITQRQPLAVSTTSIPKFLCCLMSCRGGDLLGGVRGGLIMHV
jgi:hypothetical protein